MEESFVNEENIEITGRDHAEPRDNINNTNFEDKKYAKYYQED
jgi:hypothetical protein